MNKQHQNSFRWYIPIVYTFVKIFTMKSLSLKLDEKVQEIDISMMHWNYTINSIKDYYLKNK